MNIGIPDVVIIAFIAVFAIIGIFKGFVKQIISILAIVFGTWCAFKFTGLLAEKVNGWFNLNISPNTLNLILFIAILIIVMILAHFIGKGIESLIKLSLLGWLNRLLGFLFGALKAIIILSIAVYFINYINAQLDFIPDNFLKDSKGYLLLERFGQDFFPFLKRLIS
ncbi:MAG: CvpA family protein [Bacteroidales bacterium]|nr:CvpA family protein [Bacteroidales bacterium]